MKDSRECNNEAVQDEQSTNKTRNTRMMAASHSITHSLTHSLTHVFLFNSAAIAGTQSCVGVGIHLSQPYRFDRRNPEFADSVTSTVPNPVSCSGTGINVLRVFSRMRQSLRSGLLS